jgi:hypothetical protein
VEGDRYCASCGAVLARAGEPSRPVRERVRDLIGTTRRQRIVTGITAGLIVVAVVALIATFITTEDVEEVPQDEYTLAAEEICLTSKQQVLAVLQEGSAPGPLARELVRIVAEWRAATNSLDVPADRTQLAAQLDTALREVEVQAGATAAASRTGDEQALLAAVAATEKATEQVETAIDGLGLDLCGDIAFIQTQAPE